METQKYQPKIEKQKEQNEKKDIIEQESRKLLKLTINWLIKLNWKELEEKWYIDMSDKWIKNKLLILFNGLEKSNSLSSHSKKFLEAFKDNFLNDTSAIKFLKERIILNKNRKVNKENFDDYASLLKKSVLSLYDLAQKSDKKDIDFYLSFAEKISWNTELLNKFPDLKFIIKDLLPSLAKETNKNKLSQALDSLFSNSKPDILEVLKWKKLSEQEMYNIKLDIIHNMSLFLTKLNSPEIADTIFKNLWKLQAVKSNKSLNSIVNILWKANLDKQTKFEISKYFLDSIWNLSKPNLSDQEINNFAKNTINFLNKLSNKIPEEEFKEILKILLNLSEGKNSNQINLNDLLKYIKKLDYWEIFHLLRANFWKIVDIVKKLISKWINKISVEDLLLEIFKSNILDNISKDLWYKLVEEIKKLANLNIKQLLVEWRKQLLWTDFSIQKEVKWKLKTSIEWKSSAKLANTFVDSLIDWFSKQMKEEISTWDEKLTKKEIINILKNNISKIIKEKPQLLINFLKEAGYKVENKDIKFLQDFALKIINNPKFENIANKFIDNISNIALAKKDIIGSFKEIIKEIKDETPQLAFSKEVSWNVKQIVLDIVYSKDFNEKQIPHLSNFLEENNFLPKNIDKESFTQLLLLFPKFVKKTNAENLLSDIDFKKLSNPKSLLESKKVQEDVKNIVLDTMYSKNFNENNIHQITTLLEKNKIIPHINNLDKISKIVSLFPNYINKNQAKNLLSNLNLANPEKNDYNKLLLETYKDINDKTKFINEVLDTWILSSLKSNGGKTKLSDSKINFITEIVYDTVQNSDEISLSETMEKIFEQTWNGKLNNIKVFNQSLSYLSVDFVQATKKENFKKLLEYLNNNVLTKDKLTKQDYMKLGDKILSLTDSKKFLNQIKQESNLDKNSKFLISKFDTVKKIYTENKQDLSYLAQNSSKAEKIIQTLKVKNNQEKQFMKDYVWKSFDIWHDIVENFTKEEFKQLMDIIVNKKYPVDGIKFSSSEFNLSDGTKNKLTKSFILNNFWFSIGTLFDFVKNGFKLDQADVIYNYLKNSDNKDDLQDTILNTLSKKKKTSK